MSGKVVSLEAWRQARRGRFWQTMIREALRDLVEYGVVYLTDLQLAEDVWQATWEWDELYALHGSGTVWTVEKAVGSAMMGGE